MGSLAIKVIKKNSSTVQGSAQTEEKKNTQSFSKKAMHSIEDNIKGWIEELEVRKNDELVQAHSLMGSF